MLKEKYISKIIFILPVVFTIIATISTFYISINFFNTHLKHDLDILENNELQLQKQNVKNRIDNFYNYLNYKKYEAELRLKDTLKRRVHMAFELVTKIYDSKKDILPKEELEKEILDILRKLKFGDNEYFFVSQIKNKKEIISKLLPSTPNLENINTYNYKDKNGKFFVKEFALKVSTNKNNEAYLKYSFKKLTENKEHTKLSFAKLFKPFNWIIGYGEYIDNFQEQLKKEVIKRLELYNFDENNYIWIHDINYNLIYHPYRKDDIGKNDKDLADPKNKKIMKELISNALNKHNNKFVEYYWSKPYEKKETKKVGFSRYFEDWNWVISSGAYIEDVTLHINKYKKNKEKEVEQIVRDSIYYVFLILLFVMGSSFLISRRVNMSFLTYKKEIEKYNNELELKVYEKTKELKELNLNLEEKIAKRVKELKHRDKTLAQQSKMVALGEMLGNIAHQWRQPLSTISTAASGLKVKKEMGILSKEDIDEFSDGIVNNANYLSQVIEDFKNYIKDEKEKNDFYLDEAIEKALTIFYSSTTKEIRIEKKIKKGILLNNYRNELIQSLVIILNNAKDALFKLHENKENRIVFINTLLEDNLACIVIEDTGGGIDSNLINKVFEPYFTTKDKEQGTGLGLYMVYQIVKNSMKGEIKVENSISTFENKSYTGAKFTICLTIDEDKSNT